MGILRKTRIPGTLGTAAIIALLVLSGCAKQVSPTTSSGKVTTSSTTTTKTISTTSVIATTTTTPISTPTRPYGELKIAVGTFGTEAIDPIKSTSEELGGPTGGLFDSAILFDRNSKMVPGYLDSWTLSGDGLSWVLKIHKGIAFHNGDPLTAVDVKFSIERYMLPGSKSTQMKDQVKQVDVVDDSTIRVYTNGIQPFFPMTISYYEPGQGLVTPKAYIEKNGIDYFIQHPVGTGPFKFVRRVPGDLVELEAVENHWRQTPAFKKLTTMLVPEESTRVAMLKTGGADVIPVGIDRVTELAKEKWNINSLTPRQATVYLFGSYDPRAKGMPTADVRVRKALSLAISRDDINKNFFSGLASLQVPYIGDQSIDVDIEYWRSYAANVYRHDPEAAKSLLKEAGYSNGFNIKIWTYEISGSTYMRKLSQIVADYWSRIGVQSQIVPTEWVTIRPGVYQGIEKANPEVIGNAYTHSTSVGDVVPIRLQTAYHSKGNIALLHRALPQVDTLLDSYMSETDPNRRKDMLAQVMKIATDSYTFLSLGAVPMTIASGPKVDIALMPQAIPSPAVGRFVEYAKYGKR
ncbi:MAG: ABC transporter substrate-binding protein [Chloroflexi bacterium]|nr:ABC transporter substrate-binding protein [Chloroflexota bacterium]